MINFSAWKKVDKSLCINNQFEELKNSKVAADSSKKIEAELTSEACK